MNIFRISTLWAPSYHLKIDWKHPKRPALKEWTIKAFDGKLLLACLGGLGAIPCLLFAYFALTMGWAVNLMLIIFALFIFINTFLLKQFYAIRLTDTGGEICHWKALPDFLFSSMPWLILLYILFIIWGLSQSPEMALGALASGAGLGIIYALTATSKGYKESQLRFQQWDF